MQNTDRSFQIATLISKLIQGNISPEEECMLKTWVSESEENQKIFTALTDAQQLENKLANWSSPTKKQAWNRLIAKLDQSGRIQYDLIKLSKWAAVILVFLITGYRVYLHHGQVSRENIAVRSLPVSNPLAAGKHQAMLVLGDGSKVTLEKHARITLNEKDGTSVTNQNNILSYHDQEHLNGQVVYNTMIVPRGGEYQLVLADGSKVWLNSASTLRYSTSFPGEERRVYLTGEAYFEVAKNAAKPFIVETPQSQIRVLGTHFNIMAYEDEPARKTTLLEGGIQITTGADTKILKPGQQAITYANGHQKLIDDADMDTELAWKNGLFVFKDAGITDIMRQAARWYDLKVVYEGKVPEIQFTGQMSRKVDFYGFVKILKYAGLNFNITEKTVVVTK